MQKNHFQGIGSSKTTGSIVSEIGEITERVKQANLAFDAVKAEIGRVIVGQEDLVQGLLIALLANGHVLIEGMPGLAKTLAINTLSNVIHCDFCRIQFTPDLLPSDLIGTSIYNPKDGTFHVKKGPIFTNILLADEINRAPPKVQSALLEVMQERQVTISGQTFKASEPYLVMATQNPIEQEGTYPLPEAQTDRFMLKIKIDYPSRSEEKKILARMATLQPIPVAATAITGQDILSARSVVDAIYIDDKVEDYILDLVFATRKPEDFGLPIQELLTFGGSPRASIYLVLVAKAHAFLMGRGYVTPHDVKSVAHIVLRHRLRRSYEAEAEGISSDDIIDQLLETIRVP